MISENSAVAEKLNNYFIDVIENLEIEHYNEIMDNEYISNTLGCLIQEGGGGGGGGGSLINF